MSRKPLTEHSTRRLHFIDVRPISPRLVKFIALDGVTWERQPIADGSVYYRAACPCGGRLSTGTERVKPAAVQCRKCGAWRRVP